VIIPSLFTFCGDEWAICNTNWQKPYTYICTYITSFPPTHPVGTFMPFDEEPSADTSVEPGDQATLTFATPVIARYVRIVVIAGFSAMNAGVLDTCVPCAVGKYTCSNTTTRSAICVDCVAGEYVVTHCTPSHAHANDSIST
jgi:hypothetical protein